MRPLLAAAISAAVLLGGLSQASAGRPKRPSVLAPPAPGQPPVYGFAGPAYCYGWFGVPYRDRKIYHNGFYGDYRQWSVSPGSRSH